MAKDNTKNNSASVKAVEKPSNDDSIVTVSIKKTQTKSSAKNPAKNNNSGAKNNAKNSTKVPSTQKSRPASRNSRVLNVVELGNAQPNTAIKSGGRTLNDVTKPMDVKADNKVSANANMERDAKRRQKDNDDLSGKVVGDDSKKTSGKKTSNKKRKLAIIGACIVVVLGAIAGGVYWMFGRNHNMCTVEFESNGGSKVESIEVVCGGKISRPDDPEKEGFDFREWVYRGKKFDFRNSTVNEDMILVAKWDVADDVETVTISFDSNGGSEIEDLVIKAGTAAMAPSDPTRNGYKFDGWYLDDEKFDFSEPIDDDITLVAHWTNDGAENGDNGQRPGNSGANNSSQNSQQPVNNGGSNGAGSNGSGNNNAGNGNTGGSESGDNNGNSGTGDGGNGGNTGTGGSGDPSDPGDGGNTGGDGGDPTTPGGDDNTNVPNPDGDGA